MAAIISQKFRILNAKNFIADVISETNKLYIGIGKSDPWSTTLGSATDTPIIDPTGSENDYAEYYQNLTGMAKVIPTKISHVIPKYTWSSGASDFGVWNSSSPTAFDSKFHCVYNNNVYKLVGKLIAATTTSVAPVHLTVDLPTTPADGYDWMYMYTMSAAEILAFETTNFIPVQTATAAGDRLNFQTRASGATDAASVVGATNYKGINHIRIDSGGSGYTAPTAVIEGDGTGATVTLTVVSGVITEVDITNRGSGYSIASLRITNEGSNTTASFTIMIAPGDGHGTDPVTELGGKYILSNATLEGATFVVDNDFRQLSLIQNPIEDDGTTLANLAEYDMTKAIETATVAHAGRFAADDVITGNTSGAKGICVKSDATNGYIYYIQNSKTGYGSFTNNETVSGGTTSPGTAALHATAANVTDATVSEIEFQSGDMLFAQAFAPVTRASNQTEDVKIIIEF